MPKRKSDDTTDKAAEAFPPSIVEACNGKFSSKIHPFGVYVLVLFVC